MNHAGVHKRIRNAFPEVVAVAVLTFPQEDRRSNCIPHVLPLLSFSWDECFSASEDGNGVTKGLRLSGKREAGYCGAVTTPNFYWFFVVIY